MTTPDTHAVTSIYTSVTPDSNGAEQTYDYAANYYTARDVGPDVRFGNQSNFAVDGSVTSGASLSYSSSQQLNPARLDSTPRLSMDNPFSYTSLLTTNTVNGKATSSLYTKSTGDTLVTSPVGRVSHVKRNSYGQTTQTSQASFAPVNFTYDSHGKISGTTQGTRSTTFGYNTAGFLNSITDSLTRVTSFTYDIAGRLSTTTLPGSRVISYAYDAAGNITSITPPSQPAHLFDSNLMGFNTKYTAPSADTTVFKTTYAYNNDRQLTQVVRPSGSTLTYNYGSSMGLLNSITSGSATYSFNYGSGGILSDVTSPDGVVTNYTYSGRLLSGMSNSGASSGQISLSYNNFFNLNSYQIGSDSSFVFSYDDDQLLINVGDEYITRDSSTGLISSTALGANVLESFGYNSTYGEVSSHQVKYSGANRLLESYLRDALGRITQRTVTIGTGSANVYIYTYDSVGRLTDVSLNGTNVSHYVYDANSNRTSATLGGVTTTATYDVQDRLQTYGNVIYGYNLNGEMTSTYNSVTGEVTNYIYDAFGNLKKAFLPHGVNYFYKYDGQNRRVAKLDGSQNVLERYVYLDQTRLAAVLDASGTTLITYIWGDKSYPEYMVKAGVKYKLVTDHVGSIRQVLNTSTGISAQDIVYDEFGKITSNSAPGFQVLGFASGLYDKDTKLTTFGARNYDAEVGRFISKDPILFKGGDTNLYGYTLNDPVNGIDPSGLFVIYVGVGGSGTLANSPTSGIGRTSSFLSGYGFDFGSLSFFGFHTEGSGRSAVGALAGAGASIGGFTGSKDQFMGGGTCSTVGAGVGTEGAGASTFESNSGGRGLQLDFFGPSLGIGGGFQNTTTTPGFWPRGN